MIMATRYCRPTTLWSSEYLKYLARPRRSVLLGHPDRPAEHLADQVVEDA